MKLFRIKRKSDGLFFRAPKRIKTKAKHDKIGTFFTEQPTAVANLIATDAYLNDYVLEFYSLHKQGSMPLQSSWGERKTQN